MKFCTMMDDDIYIEAREAYEYRFGRWKRGSFKDLLEKSLRVFIEKYPTLKQRKRR